MGMGTPQPLRTGASRNMMRAHRTGDGWRPREQGVTHLQALHLKGTVVVIRAALARTTGRHRAPDLCSGAMPYRFHSFSWGVFEVGTLAARTVDERSALFAFGIVTQAHPPRHDAGIVIERVVHAIQTQNLALADIRVEPLEEAHEVIGIHLARQFHWVAVFSAYVRSGGSNWRVVRSHKSPRDQAVSRDRPRRGRLKPLRHLPLPRRSEAIRIV